MKTLFTRFAVIVLCLSLLSSGAAFAFGLDKSTPDIAKEFIVQTKQGQVSGHVEKGVNAWLGIPYAQAPIGKLRFQSPQPPSSWEGVRKADSFGAPSIQSPSQFLGDATPSEDCLFLNIWSPAADAKKRPVMLWIHGGGFVVGSSTSEMYNGANLSRNGDVVVVSINYRLGILGFLYFDKFIQEKYGYENNVGIRDQIAALKWVKENIAAFGGDPENITIFGESAGGTSVETLLATPAAKGLFTGAIAESGPASVLWQPEVACNITNKFLRTLGVSADSLQLLQTMPADSLLKAQDWLLNYMVDKTTQRVFSPTIDGEFLTNDIATCLSPKQSGNVALMIGTNNDEATMFASKRLHMVPSKEEELDREFLSLISTDAKKTVTAAYPGYPKKRAILDLLTDAVFRIPAVRVAECQSMHSPVYMYKYEWTSPLLNMVGLRSFHGLEIPFVFGNSDGRIGKILRIVASKKTFKNLSGSMQQAWINFARYKNPNGQGEEVWKKYDKEDRATMIFNKKTQLVNDPGKAQREAWDGVYYY